MKGEHFVHLFVQFTQRLVMLNTSLPGGKQVITMS